MRTRSPLARLRLILATSLCVAALLPVVGHAAVPASALVEGLLYSTGGGPVADGSYKAMFAIYKDAAGGAPVWSEGPLDIAVKGGLFTHPLGAAKPLTPDTLAGLSGAWLGIAVGGDPELPRTPLTSALFALRAGALDCSGCVGAAQLDPKLLAPFAKTADLAKVAASGAYADLIGAPDLSAYAKASDLGVYAKSAALAKVASSGQYADLVGAPDLSPYAKSAALAAVASSGSHADLKNVPAAAKLGAACGTGLLLKGLKVDGSYECAVAMDPSALPADSLNEVSNGLLTNQFSEVAPSTKVPIDIPDNNPTGLTDVIDVPDFGIAQGLKVSVDVANSDVAKVTITLKDPAGAKYTLHAGATGGATLKATYPVPVKPAAGDLGSWIGKNPKGKWELTVVDGAFINNQNDGKLNAWSVTVDVLSTKKVAATQGFQFGVHQSHPLACTPSNFGYTYANDKDKALYVCNGKVYYPITLVPIGTAENPGVHCKDIIAKQPASKDGVYWINGGGSTAFEVYCDMTSDGGGWTLVLNLQTSDGATRHYFDTDFWTTTSKVGDLAGAFTADFKSQAFSAVAAKSLMMRAHNNGSQQGWATYDLLSNATDKSLHWMFNNLTNATATTKRLKNQGAVGNPKGAARYAGDAFVDNDHAVIINSRYSPADADNYTRLGTNYGDKCGAIACDGHNFGGWGGRHYRGGWGAYWEGAALNGYCNAQGAFGSNGTGYNGNNAFAGCGAVSTDVDLAVFVR